MVCTKCITYKTSFSSTNVKLNEKWATLLDMRSDSTTLFTDKKLKSHEAHGVCHKNVQKLDIYFGPKTLKNYICDQFQGA